jgi:D-cysteine desulfhydrase
MPTLKDTSDLPLFRAYPSLVPALKRFEILHGPTPLEPLFRLEEALRKRRTLDPDVAGRLWVKRDDMSWTVLGGNKARKLEFLLADAAAHDAHTLVTAGMWGSNHALATAEAAHELGLRSRLILGPQPVTEDVKRKLLAFHALGAELVYHGNKIGMGIDLAAQMAAQWLKIRKGVYYIPPGGSNDVGSVGYVNAFFELLEQSGPDRLPSEIFVPLGSGGTSAGLLVGMCLAGKWDQVKIHSQRVVSELLYNEHKLRKDAQKLRDYLVSLMSPEDRARAPKCDFDSKDSLVVGTAHTGPEYGAAEAPVLDGMRLLSDSEGLKLDVTYSGKAFADFLDRAEELRPGSSERPVLFWLTYNSRPLDAIITAHAWTDPEHPWRDLPRPFWKLFEKNP